MDVRAVCLGIRAPSECGAVFNAKRFILQREKATPSSDAHRLVRYFGEAADFDSFLAHGTAAVTHPARRTCG
jgi:hypothetical protein